MAQPIEHTYQNEFWAKMARRRIIESGVTRVSLITRNDAGFYTFDEWPNP